MICYYYIISQRDEWLIPFFFFFKHRVLYIPRLPNIGQNLYLTNFNPKNVLNIVVCILKGIEFPHRHIIIIIFIVKVEVDTPYPFELNKKKKKKCELLTYFFFY